MAPPHPEETALGFAERREAPDSALTSWSFAEQSGSKLQKTRGRVARMVLVPISKGEFALVFSISHAVRFPSYASILYLVTYDSG